MNGSVNNNETRQEPVRVPVPQLTPIREMPLYNDFRELLEGCKDRYGEDIAFIIKTKKATKTEAAQYRNVSFIQLRKDVDLHGSAFLRLGLKGKRLAIIGKNRYEWILGFYAHICGVGVAVPLDKGLPFDELVSTCDILSVHLAVTPETTGLVGKSVFDRMKQGSILINTARGEIVDQEALCRAILTGRLSGAGLDTLSPEPVTADNHLLALPPEARDRVLLSPHIAGITEGSFRRYFDIIWENARRLNAGEKLINRVV